MKLKLTQTLFGILLFGMLQGQVLVEMPLERAIERTLQNNFQIIISGKNFEIAQKNNSWGQAGAFPSIGINSTYGKNWTDQDNPASFINGLYSTGGIKYGGELNWILFNGFKVQASKQSLALLEQQSEGNASIVVENTLQALLMGYYHAILQKEKRDVLLEVLQLSKERYEQMKERKAFGSAGTFEILQEQNELLTDSINFVQQQLAYRNACRNLNLIMAEDVEMEYSLTTAIPEIVAKYELDTLKGKLFSNNYMLQNQYINNQLIKKEIKQYQSGLYPVVSFNVGGNNSNSTFERGDFTADAITLNYYFNFGLNFNLFNGGKVRRAIQNAHIKDEIGIKTTEEMKLSLHKDILGAYDLYTTRMNVNGIAVLRQESAKIHLQLAEERWQLGAINSFDYRDVKNNYRNASVQLLEARYYLLIAQLEMLKLTGGILEEFEPAGN